MDKRLILFRGKRIDNGAWVYGDYSRYSKEKSIIMVDLLEQEDYWVPSETVGQYTGLKDKNGVEIYEGDIIHWDWEKIPYLVYWSDKTCQFTTDMRWLWSSIENVEVIGNIHDNPELMEV